jgi:hypothetical protein
MFVTSLSLSRNNVDSILTSSLTLTVPPAMHGIYSKLLCGKDTKPR